MALPATRRLASILVFSALWLILWCAPAFAHAALVKAEPAAGTRLEQAPSQVRLTFDEPVDAEFSPIKVYDSEGTRADQDDARVAPDDARVVEVDLVDGLSAGSYRVEWRVTSVDGHVVNGEYRFSVAAAGNAGSNNEGNAGGSERQRAAQGESGQESAGSNDMLLFSAVGIGVLGVIVLAVLITARLRQRKP